MGNIHGSHGRTLFVISVLFLFLAVLIFGAFYFHPEEKFGRHEETSLIALAFLAAFWFTYFTGSFFRLGTLRVFLDKNTYRRDGSDDDLTQPEKTLVMERRNTALLARCAASTTSQSFFMAVIALFLWPVLDGRSVAIPSPYQLLLRPLVIGLGLLTIFFMLWSIDLLDTAQNVFRGDDSLLLKRRIYFSREIGVTPQGAASYRYFGFATMTIFLISAVSFFKPGFAGLAVPVFCYLGYPVLFGYSAEYDREGKILLSETDPAKWPPVLLLTAGLALNLIFG
jgi:hypothetical protein